MGDVDSGNSTSNSPDENYFYKKDKLEQGTIDRISDYRIILPSLDTLSPISFSMSAAATMQELLDLTHSDQDIKMN